MEEKTLNKTIRLILLKILPITVVATTFLMFLTLLFVLEFPKRTMNLFGFGTYLVQTETMRETIEALDIVFVSKADFDSLEVGNIIGFEADINYDGNRVFVAHYIHEITEDIDGNRVFRTNREGSTIPDARPLRDEDVIGAYNFRIANMGYPVEFVKSPFGIAAIIVNIAIVTAIIILLKSDKNEKLEQKNK